MIFICTAPIALEIGTAGLLSEAEAIIDEREALAAACVARLVEQRFGKVLADGVAELVARLDRE
ncbi:hypothetical protein ASD89_16215 [Caulobacter sp. Root656]|nr:hypothetical protein ASD89_16215 [Caulobacter sp. Root656]